MPMKKFLNDPKHLVTELLEGFTLAYADKVRLCAPNTVGRANPMTIAAAEADAGAQSTTTLLARLGRARSLGVRTLGHPDPGAVSIGILFAGFRDALNSIDENENHV